MEHETKSTNGGELLTLNANGITPLGAENQENAELMSDTGDSKSNEDPTMVDPFSGFPPLCDTNSQKLSPSDPASQEIESALNDMKALCSKLEKENVALVEKIKQLEETIGKLKREKKNSSQPLPALYVQLTSTKQALAEFEKKVQDLESENMELTLRLEKDISISGEEDIAGRDPSMLPSTSVNSPVKKSSFIRSASHNISRVVSTSRPLTSVCKEISSESELLKSSSGTRAAELESEKLVLAEKLVKKEEEVQALEEKIKEYAKELALLEAGIDGIETRFELQITTHISKANQHLDLMWQTASSLEQRGKKLDASVESLGRDLTTTLKRLPGQLRENADGAEPTFSKSTSKKERIEEELESKTKNLEEAKKQISIFSDKVSELDCEMKQVRSYTCQLEKKIVEMKAARLLPVDPTTKTNASAAMEIKSLKQRNLHLESALEDQRSLNETLLREKEVTETAGVSGTTDYESVEQLMKENTELRNELFDVSSKLVSVEEENDSMRSAADNHDELLGRCLSLEEEIEALKTINKDLEDHLSRKKKRLEKLQGELKKLRQQIDDVDSRGFGSRKRPINKVSGQVDALVQAERRYEDLEVVVAEVRSERNALLREKVSVNKTMHSLIKENKSLSKNLIRYQDATPQIEEKLEKANSKILKLQAQVKVYSLACRNSGKGLSGAAFDEEIVNKLVASQISLAEMDERMIRLRRELHKAVARNMYLVSKVSRLEKRP